MQLYSLIFCFMSLFMFLKMIWFFCVYIYLKFIFLSSSNHVFIDIIDICIFFHIIFCVCINTYIYICIDIYVFYIGNIFGLTFISCAIDSLSERMSPRFLVPRTFLIISIICHCWSLWWLMMGVMIMMNYKKKKIPNNFGAWIISTAGW